MMKLTMFFGVLILSVQWQFTNQQNIISTGKPNDNISKALGFNGMNAITNPYANYPLNYYLDESNPPLLMMPNPQTNDLNSNPNTLDIQPIFKLFQRPVIVKPTQENKINGVLDFANNVQYFPQVFSEYGEQYFGNFPLPYSLYDPFYGFDEVPEYEITQFLTPAVSYVDLNEIAKPYPYQSRIYLPNRDIATSEDETYKAILKSVSTINGRDQNGIANPVRGFRTNFSGDISKCDMICKCRNIFVKPTTSSELPQSARSVPRKRVYK